MAMPEAARSSDSVPPLAIVTGASSGMGRSIALELARRGWATLLIARRTALLEALASELRASAPSAILTMDLCETGAIVDTVRGFLAANGLVPRALFNNAGFGFYGPFLEQPTDLHERLWRVNYLAAVEMTRAVLPGMLERRKGHVINTASMSTKVGPWGHAGYAASKAALVSVTQGLAAEHPARASGVHFSFVNPGIVRTSYFEASSFAPLWKRVAKRAISPERVARAAVNLLERPRLQICVPWYYRAIDAIDAVSPALAHRIVAAESRPLP